MTSRYDLLKELYAIIDGIPEERFNLRNIIAEGREANPCDTIACAAGWAAMHPLFKAEGLGLTKQGGLTYEGEQSFFPYPVEQVFGLTGSEAYDLFGQNDIGVSVYDYESTKDFSDKKLFLHRLREFLKEHGQLSN